MISIFTENTGEVVAKLDKLDARMTEELRAGISRLTFKLQENVKNNKLSGQVLGVRTGRGKRSIQTGDIKVAGNRIIGEVSTNVFYMIGWELGWPDAKGRESMAAGKGKFSLGGGDTFKNGSPKKRSFLIPSLKELSESGAIETEINAAVARAST